MLDAIMKHAQVYAEQSDGAWEYAKDWNEVKAIFVDGATIGYAMACDDITKAVERELSYRSYREDQDGSAIGACKEILGYITVLRKRSSI